LARFDSELSGITDAVERAVTGLVHPGVAAADRPAQGRFLRLAFAAPLLAPLLLAPAFAQDLGGFLAGTLAAFAIGWGAAALTLATGSIAIAGALLVIGAAAFIAAAAALAGVAASPLLLVLIALPVEARLVTRTAAPARLATLVALAAGLSAFAAGQGGPAALGLHWLAPAAWAATAWLRRPRPAPRIASAEIDRIALFGGIGLAVEPSGRVAEVSASARDLAGLDPALLCGNGLFDRLHVADRVDWLAALAELREGATARRLRLRLRVPAAAPGDGSGHLELDVDLALDGDRIAGLMKPAALPPMPAAIDPAELELAKSRFLAAVSHELRTPLNAIIGFSDMLLHGLFGGFADPRQREYVELISDSGHHLLGVVNAILDVSKIEAGTYDVRAEPFCFADAVDMSVSMVERQAAAKHITLANQVTRCGRDLTADRRAVQQILINLLSNAVKFTPDGGQVTIACARRPGLFEFTVADTGIGISEQNLARLGRPFTQIENDLTRSHDGTGLGLSLVKGLVELHHGRVSIESAPGAGTLVRVGLPDSGRAAAVRNDTEAGDGAGGATLRKTG